MSGREVRPVFRQGQWKDASGWKLDHFIRKMIATLERRMRVTGQKFGRWTQSFSDGTRIIVSANFNGPAPVFHANVIPGPSAVVLPQGPVYLETGIVAFPDYLDCDSGGTAGSLYFNDELQTWFTDRIGSDLFSYIGEFTPDVSLPLPAYPPLPDQPLTTDQNAGTEVSQSFGCARTGFKEAAQKLPPSIFSGKYTRLLVQSKYGRRDTTISETASITAITIDGQLLSSSAAASHGIYLYETTTTIEYWLLQLSVGTLSVGKLVLPDWADELATYIVTEGITGTDRTRLEGWILAYSRWPVEMVVVETGLPTINPLSYGWRFKNDGTQAKAVTVTGSFIAGYTFSTETVDITLSYIGSVPSWTVVGDTVSHGTDLSFSNLIFMWALNAAAGYDALVSSSPDSFTNVPVFGWFDSDDVWTTETLSSTSGSGSEDVEINNRDKCNLTWSGTCFKGSRNYTSAGLGKFSHSEISAGIFSYTGSPLAACSGIQGTLEQTSTDESAISGWLTGSTGTDLCGDKPDEPSCFGNLHRHKRTPNREYLSRRLGFGGFSSYSAFTFFAPARGDCNKFYVGTWVEFSARLITSENFRRRTHYHIEPYECWTEEGIYVETGWTWDAKSVNLAGWTGLGTTTSTIPHAPKELSVKLAGDMTTKTVFIANGTSGTPEAGYKAASAMGSALIDLNVQFGSGGWGSYVTAVPISVSPLIVKTSAILRSLAYTPNPEADIQLEDDTWGVPAGELFLFEGWA